MIWNVYFLEASFDENWKNWEKKMDAVEKNIELSKEHKVLEALIKLSKESTREAQRLEGKIFFELFLWSKNLDLDKLAFGTYNATDCLSPLSYVVDFWRKFLRKLTRDLALKLAWSSRRRTDAIRSNWGVDHDEECGALLEFSQISIPLNPARNTKKRNRRAVYITGKCGSKVVERKAWK